MNDVEFIVRVECVKKNLAPEQFEWSMHQHIFLTGHFIRDPVEISFAGNHEKVKQVAIRGRLPPQAEGRIPATAAIVFAGTAIHHNDSLAKIPVRVDIGTTHIMLSEIIGKPLPFRKETPLELRTTEDRYSKAVLRVTIDKPPQIGKHLIMSPMHINASLVGQQMNDILQLTYETEMRMGNTIPGTDNVRCFLNISEEGSQLTGAPVPALGYAFGEVPKSNGKFWQNALERVFAREGLSVANYFQMTRQEQASMAVLLCDYPIWTLPYVGDMIDRRKRQQDRETLKIGYENFGECLALLGGDCEDLAKGITKVRRALKKYVQTSKDLPPDDHTQKILVDMDKLMDQYVMCMSLCVVHGAKADDSSDAPKGAHMADVVMPVEYVKSQMERTEDGKELSRTLPWPQNIERGLEVLIGEGTGRLHPRGFQDESGRPQARSYLIQNSTWIRQLKSDMNVPHGGESPFFLGMMQGWTTYFADRGASRGTGGLWYTDERKDHTRGALYTDVVNARQNVGLRPMPSVPESVQLLMMEANTFCIPPLPLVLTRDHTHTRNRHLDALVSGVSSLSRTQGKRSVAVHEYLAAHQASEGLSKGLLSDVKDRLGRVWKVEYKLEAVTDHYHGYQVTFHVNLE